MISQTPTQPSVIDLTPAELQAVLGDEQTVLVDVRDPFERAEQHISGSVHVPLATLDPAALRQRFPDQRIVFHCAGGKRSARACAQLAQADDAPAEHLAGGLAAWADAGLPIERPTTRRTVIPIMRQVQIAAGSLIVLGLALGHFLAAGFLLISAFVGCGLIFAGVTGWCGMAKLLAKMPWNRSNASA